MRTYGEFNYGDCFYGGAMPTVPPPPVPLVENPADSGLYDLPPGFVEAPASSGLYDYTLDGLVYSLIEEPAMSGLYWLVAFVPDGLCDLVLGSSPCPRLVPVASGPADRLANLVPCPAGADC